MVNYHVRREGILPTFIMEVLIDTNVALDVILNNTGFAVNPKSFDYIVTRNTHLVSLRSSISIRAKPSYFIVSL
jgi:predicted nucleic acid-binding protein